MKRLGLIGGLGPESTVQYYQIIRREHSRRCGGLSFPELTIESMNLQRPIGLFEQNDWDGVGGVLLEALGRLKAAGADFAAILAHTPHNAHRQIHAASPLKIPSIMDATTAALVRDGRHKVALLGTRPTMEFGFFQERFQAHGIQPIVPNPEQQLVLDRMIWSELSHGSIKPESRVVARVIIGDLVHQGAEAVILRCTELGLLIQPEDSARPLYDTTRLHAEAILEYALEGSADRAL